MTSIATGTKVCLQFQLTLADGTLIDETGADEDLEFVVGDGTLAGGLEQRLLDLAAGAKVTFNVPADEAVFGQPDPEKFREVARSDFPESVEIGIGNVVAFDLPNGDEVLGVIQDADDENVTVDFNHPLVGRDFIFDVTIISVS